MEPLQLKLIDAFGSIKSIWHNQSKQKKYITIIALSIPSFILLRNLYWYFYRKYHSLAPGPNGLPLFGMMFTWNVGNNSSQERINLSLKYGPIFYSTMMGMQVTTIASSKLVKQIFPLKEFLNRKPFVYRETDYHTSMNTIGKTHQFPLVQTNGEKWKRRRKLAQDTLFKVLNRENTGNLLKQTMETEFKPYLDELCQSSKEWHPREIFEYIALNTIYSTLYNEKLDRNSEIFHQIQKDMEDSIKYAGLDALVTKYGE